MPSREIVIDPLLECPPESAYGGYACGLLAECLATGVEITHALVAALRNQSGEATADGPDAGTTR